MKEKRTTKPTMETKLAIEQRAKTIKRVAGSSFFCATQPFITNWALGGKLKKKEGGEKLTIPHQ